MKILLLPIRALLIGLAHLPKCMLYALSDALFPILYHLVRYRRKLVRQQLADSFPQKSESERRAIERRFYHFFCDLMVEYIMMLHLKPEEMMRRVEFIGMEKAMKEAEQLGKRFCFFCPGHFGNWEWLSSYALWTLPGWDVSQIYHPLHNNVFDQFLLELRSQYGGKCIAMKDTLRHILTTRRNNGKECVAFISDQSPLWEAMHHWTRFLNHDTSFFIGAERIGKQVDASIFYVKVSRPRRGYYKAEIIPIAMDAPSQPNYHITDTYAQMLEQQIIEHPELWLWTHNRWKRTKEEWEKRQHSHK